MATSYEDSDVYKLAKQMAVEIHRMTLNELPKFEMYEQGSQIRRSSKSIVANFVEGYGRRHYKAEYIKFLTYSLASCDETKSHLELLNKTDSIRPERFQNLYSKFSQNWWNALPVAPGCHRRTRQISRYCPGTHLQPATCYLILATCYLQFAKRTGQ